MSERPSPVLPKSISSLTKFRFNYGKGRVLDKLKRLIDLVLSHGYEFSTFGAIREEILQERAGCIGK